MHATASAVETEPPIASGAGPTRSASAPAIGEKTSARSVTNE